MSDRKCICNHWANKDHEIDLQQSGEAKSKCNECGCQGVCLP